MTSSERKFVLEVEIEIEDFFTTELMNAVDNIARVHKIPDDQIAGLLGLVDTNPGPLDKVWEEYTG